MKKIPVSPPHFIDTIVLTIIIMSSLIAITIAHIILEFDDVIYPYLGWGLYSVGVIPIMILTHRGAVVTNIDQEMLKSVLITKTCCQLGFAEVQYVSLMLSYNYGRDLSPIYVVCSKEPIGVKGVKHIALTYKIKKQIVIRVSRKKYEEIKDALLPLQIHEYLPRYFEGLRTRLEQQEIHLKRTSEDTWEIVPHYDCK